MALGATLLLCGVVAQRRRIAPPVLLLAGGTLMLSYKRATVVRLRDERRIDDTVLRQVQSKLDIEEVRLTGTFLAE